VPRETALAKADRLLVAGAVKVTHVDGRTARAVVTGDHDSYEVEHEDRWRCSCPSFGVCSHGIAVSKVVSSQRASTPRPQRVPRGTLD
jgi:uncharacterized Zn finger protein